MEKGQGKVQVELNRCAMEAIRAENRGGGGWGLCMLEVFAFSNAARVRIVQGGSGVHKNIAGLRHVPEGSRCHSQQVFKETFGR